MSHQVGRGPEGFKEVPFNIQETEVKDKGGLGALKEDVLAFIREIIDYLGQCFCSAADSRSSSEREEREDEIHRFRLLTQETPSYEMTVNPNTTRSNIQDRKEDENRSVDQQRADLRASIEKSCEGVSPERRASMLKSMGFDPESK